MCPSLSFQGKEIASDYLGPSDMCLLFSQWFKHEEMLSHETPGPDIQWEIPVAQHDLTSIGSLCRLVSQS